ncbi:ABC transporter, permease protein [Aeropyrum pernix]|uniref:ABC transporter, permease protein n=1 Tax=Aeropyrum pernix TaxID=56636 RepID=A0A401H9K7_AERPX|nr:branched-chain amino acid ABC transporter permease [Aeropyrum pernix]GBF09121.1 ABC transporter, permease protein [Aeropyrum pernix]
MAGLLEQWGNLVFQGVLMGLLYSLIALGYNIVYRVNKSINFAVPEVVLLAAYLAWIASIATGNLLAAVAIALAASIAVSMAMERFVARPLLGRPPIALIGATLGLFYMLKGVVLIVGKGEVAVLPFYPEVYRLGFLTLGTNDIIALLGSIAVLAGVIILHRKTSFGAAMRGVAEDAEGAAAYGLPVRRLMLAGWALAGLVSGLAALLLSIKTQVSPDLEFFAIIALAASLIAGLDSLGGIVVGGVFLGLAEQIASKTLDPYLPGIGRDIAFFILLLVLLVKPYGLFGSERIERL